MNENHLSKALYFTEFYHFSFSFLKEHGYVPLKLADFFGPDLCRVYYFRSNGNYKDERS